MMFTTHFVHDHLGNVIAETAGGGATGAAGTVREYIWLPETEIAPTSGSRTTIDRPLAVVDAVNTASPATYWVSVDHLNRPFRMTNSSRASVWDAVWQPWGGVHSITGTAALDARFPGQWFQLETGLHYNWHRSYDPTLGRYTQPDPLGFVDGPSVFGYAGGSPLGLSDFDGLYRRPDPWGTAGAERYFYPRQGGGDYVLGPRRPTPSPNPKPPTPIPSPEPEPESENDDDRSIELPECPRSGCTCTCRADANDNIVGNIRPGENRPRYAFATVTAADCRIAKKQAKREATQQLGLQPKHVKCRCNKR